MATLAYVKRPEATAAGLHRGVRALLGAAGALVMPRKGLVLGCAPGQQRPRCCTPAPPPTLTKAGDHQHRQQQAQHVADLRRPGVHAARQRDDAPRHHAPHKHAGAGERAQREAVVARLDGGDAGGEVGRAVAQGQQRDAAQPRRQAQLLADLGEDAGKVVVGGAADDAEEQREQGEAEDLRVRARGEGGRGGRGRLGRRRRA